MSRSACRASIRAGSSSSVTTAFSFRPVVESRSRQPSVSSTGESCLVRSRAASSRTGRKKTEGSSMAASGAEDEVGFVAVRELDRAQALSGIDAALQLFGDGLELIGIEMLPIATLNDRRQRLRVFRGRLVPRRRGGLAGVGGGGARFRGLHEHARRSAERGGKTGESHELQ